MKEIIPAILRSAQLTFIGRVGRDPEVKYFQSGAINCKFSIAINRGKKDEELPPDWFKCELWSEMAVAAGDAIKKGDLVKLTGRVSIDRWTGQDGTENVDKVIRAEEWSVIPTAAKTPRQQQPAPANEFGDFDDSIPF
jgi:single-strand DNA-binding protein